jgi:hypothetical protein
MTKEEYEKKKARAESKKAIPMVKQTSQTLEDVVQSK